MGNFVIEIEENVEDRKTEERRIYVDGESKAMWATICTVEKDG